MTVYCLTVRGTSEKFGDPNNLLTKAVEIARAGGPATQSPWPSVRTLEVPYPASIGPANEQNNPFGDSLMASLDLGVAAIKDTIRKVRVLEGGYRPDTRIILMGYSLGALIVQRYLTLEPQSKGVDRALLLANPGGKYLVPYASGWRREGATTYSGIASGIADDRPLQVMTSDRLDVWHIAHPMDPIANMHPKNPLRSIVPWLWGMDLDNPVPWLNDVFAQITSKQAWAWTHFWEPGYTQGVAEMLPDLQRYLTIYHTTIYSEGRDWRLVMDPPGVKRTGLEIVARRINDSLWLDRHE